MQHIGVKSSNVESIGYDPESQELQVKFKAHKEGEPGRCYSYAGVSHDQYRQFLNAESVGHHFAVFIRPCFDGRRIDTPKEEKKDAEKAKKD
jgi:hypothetical protein